MRITDIIFEKTTDTIGKNIPSSLYIGDFVWPMD